MRQGRAALEGQFPGLSTAAAESVRFIAKGGVIACPIGCAEESMSADSGEPRSPANDFFFHPFVFPWASVRRRIVVCRMVGIRRPLGGIARHVTEPLFRISDGPRANPPRTVLTAAGNSLLSHDIVAVRPLFPPRIHLVLSHGSRRVFPLGLGRQPAALPFAEFHGTGPIHAIHRVVGTLCKTIVASLKVGIEKQSSSFAPITKSPAFMGIHSMPMSGREQNRVRHFDLQVSRHFLLEKSPIQTAARPDCLSSLGAHGRLHDLRRLHSFEALSQPLCS